MPDFGIMRGFGSKLFSDKLVAGQLPTQLGKIGSENFGFVGLLDTYPNAAAAYSVRKLRLQYTGSAIRVRRSSDNTEQDIGFDINGNLNTTALTSFCGSGNGFVTTWYDQSGNARNVTQSTAASQPQIVSSGSVITQNTKPCIEFDGNDWFSNSTNGVLQLDQRTHFVVAKENTSVNFAGIISYSPSSGDDFANNNGGNLDLGNGGTFGNTNIDLPGAVNNVFLSGTKPMPYRLISYYSNSTTIYLQANNGTFQSKAHQYTANAFQSGKIHIGVRFLSGAVDIAYSMKGLIQEIVMYNGSGQNSNISTINSNINSYYGIY